MQLKISLLITLVVLVACAHASPSTYDVCWNFVDGELVPRPLYAFIPFEFQMNLDYDCAFTTCDGRGGLLYISYFDRPIVMTFNAIENKVYYYFMPLTAEEEMAGLPYYPWPLNFPPAGCQQRDWRTRMDKWLVFNQESRYQFWEYEPIEYSE